MIRKTCDVCDKLINRQDLDGDDDVSLKVEFGGKSLSIEPTITTNDHRTKFDVCRHCLIDMLKTLDDRPKAARP